MGLVVRYPKMISRLFAPLPTPWHPSFGLAPPPLWFGSSWSCWKSHAVCVSPLKEETLLESKPQQGMPRTPGVPPRFVKTWVPQEGTEHFGGSLDASSLPG